MKKNKLTAAVLAGVAGVSGMANAVHINPEGTGQVLIYPYFAANKLDADGNALNTTYSVVNTTDRAKAVKVRFLEGHNSREVLDFNVYLSPYDVWVGVVGGVVSAHPGYAGQDSAAHASGDTSCAPFLDKAYKEFLPYQMELDRVAPTMEHATDGHFEVIEMGELEPAEAALVDHTNVGVPGGCDMIQAMWDDGGAWDIGPSTLDPATGGLFGGATILEVTKGTAMSYNAIALDNFWNLGNALHTNPGDLFPSLANVSTDAVRFVDGAAVTSIYADSIDNVSALFMTDRVYNEYVVDTGRDTKTEWVVTFPTKNYYINGGVRAPFTTPWSASTASACEEFDINVWDREEQPAGDDECGGVSPVNPNAPGCAPVICYEANVVEFHLPSVAAPAESSILGSDNLVTVKTPSQTHATPNGWASLMFDDMANVLPALNGPNYEGLPTAGFMVQRYTNGAAQPGILAQYAATFNHVTRVVSN